MKILILGASGLIGHQLYRTLSRKFDNVLAVLHGDLQRFQEFNLFDPASTFENVSVEDTDEFFHLLDHEKPDVVLNCAGITKRRPEIENPLKAIAVNALFPHQLSDWALRSKSRIIHFSTDCVFDGAVGNYNEDSITTPQDSYGRTKALGELRNDHTLTIRSSFVGQELSIHSELLGWFLHQKRQKIDGYKNVMYTGVSTLEMARVVAEIIEFHPGLNGLYNLSTDNAISKYDLLCLAREAYGINVDIIPDTEQVSRPTLDGSRLRKAIELEIPDWSIMMNELASQQSFYSSKI